MAIMTSWLRRRGGKPRDKTRTASKTFERGTDSAMPYERDESSDASPAPIDPRVEQAHDDLKAGRKDTGRESAIQNFEEQQARQRRRRPIGK
jgi:hypothetical protein